MNKCWELQKMKINLDLFNIKRIEVLSKYFYSLMNDPYRGIYIPE